MPKKNVKNGKKSNRVISKFLTMFMIAALALLIFQIINLCIDRSDRNLGIHKACRTDDLFNELSRCLSFKFPRSCGYIFFGRL